MAKYRMKDDERNNERQKIWIDSDKVDTIHNKRIVIGKQ